MNRIKELRKEKKIKQTELAVMLKVTQASISQWEAEKTSPSDEEKIKLCNIFNCTLDYLMGYTDINLKEKPTNKNIVTVFGRDDSGKVQYTISDKQFNAIKAILEEMKNVPEDDNF